jgi:hypothetical protein
MKRRIQASNDFKVIIDTGLTDPKALDVLNGVCGQLSDGIWENSPRMIPFWNCIDVDGGKLIFNTGSYYDYRYNGYNSSPFRAMSEQQMKTWFANKIKQVVKQFESDYGSEGKWDRNNTAVCDYLNYNSGATVQDAYRVYDVLLGRKPRIQEVETNKKVCSTKKPRTIKYVKASIDNEEQIIEQTVKQCCDIWEDSEYAPTTLNSAIWEVANDIHNNTSLSKDIRRYFLNFIDNYLSSDVKDNSDYDDTYNKIVNTLYKYNIEKYIAKSGEHGDKYFVTYYEEYPIYESAEGGYYYAGNEVAYQAEFDTLEEAERDFEQVVDEYDLTRNRKHEAFKYSKYIGEGASAFIESDTDINFPSVNSKVSGWHPYN